MFEHPRLYDMHMLLQEKDVNAIEVVEPKEKTTKEKVGEGMILISKIIMCNSMFAFLCSPAWLLFTDDITYMGKHGIISLLLGFYGLLMYGIGQTIRDDD